MIDKIKDQIEKNLESFMIDAEKRYGLKKIHPLLHKSIHEYCLRKGKRIRPLLFILSYKGYCTNKGKTHPTIYNISSAIELLHNFMLIHDDIIDRSDLRRGKPTMHKLLKNTVQTKDAEKLGNDLGIIAGDIIYAFSIEAFFGVKADHIKREKAFKYFVETTAVTAIGEFIDTVHGVETIVNIKEKDVQLNHSYKTARYTFVAPMIIGAILAGAKNPELKKLSEFGMLIGQAFQLQDDIIGVFGSEKNIGKSVLSDFQESKKTFLVCKAFEKLTLKKRRDFINIFNKPKKTFKDLLIIRKMFIDSGSLKYSLKEIKNRIENASGIFKTLHMKNKLKDKIRTSINDLFSPSLNIAEKHGINFSIE